MNMFIISVIVLLISMVWLPWWGILVVSTLLIVWWLYTLSPRYSLGGYSFLAPSKEKILALTFSGGTQEKITGVLSWLEEHNIPGLFFIYGELVEENPQVARDIFQAGHMLGIAGFEAKENWFMRHFDSDDIHKAIHRSQEVFAVAIPHFHASLFRPFRGRKMILNPWRLKHNFGYHVVLWSFSLGKNSLQKIKSRMIINVDLDALREERLFSQLQALQNYTQMHGYQFVQIEV